MKPGKPGHPLWLLLLLTCTAAAQSPGGVSAGLSLWVRAESATPAAGGKLTQWTDQTGNNTFTLSNNNMTTVTNVINFHPIVRFTGTGKLIGNRSITWTECTAVASWTGSPATERGTVISPTTSGTAPNDASRYFFRSGVEANPGDFTFAGMGTDSIGFEYISSPPSTQVSILTASGPNNVFNANGVNAVVGSLFGGFTKRATSYTGIPQIGDRSTNDAPMIGDIAEIIVYSVDNTAGRNRVESYLALKYGLTLGNATTPVSYTSSAGTVFWNGSAGYQHDIFGIGTDQASGLTQTSSNSMNSGSGNGAGQSKKGNLVLQTTTALADQHFLMIGTDSAALTEETITTAMGPAIAVASKRLVRTWQVQNTGAVGAISLSFDKSGLTLSGGNTAANYYLMIDNDGDGNFNTGTQTFYNASSITGTLVNFTSVTLGDRIVFTVITLPKSLLPLVEELESFTAMPIRQSAHLQWSISGALPIDHFDIQRSADGVRFITITTIDADTAATYRYSDPVSAGTWFYRLHVVYTNANDQFSPVRSIQIAETPTVRIYPNPVQNNRLNLQLDGLLQTASIRIIDRQGGLHLQQQTTLQPGTKLLSIDLPPLPAGLYFAQVQTATMSCVLTFVKY